MSRKLTFLHLIPLLGAILALAPAQEANATSISFFGSYDINDTNGDGFSETLDFRNTLGPNDGLVSLTGLSGDDVFFDTGAETVRIATLMLDPTSGPGNFGFSPQTYVDGFAIIDHEGTLLLEGDLTVMTLQTGGSTGNINPALVLNLTNITGLGGLSPIIDTFLTGPGGSVNITLQLQEDLSTAIVTGQNITSTYSGSLAAVPEPTSLLLLGSGLSGLGLIGRRKSRLNKNKNI